ncbi:MAG: efflux RND transporter periplasmic adaptor subunit [Marinibacterium sp.]|nr:efflux RND transporter periplasmic adaptor subunit [Marinibacterium sp.]
MNTTGTGSGASGGLRLSAALGAAALCVLPVTLLAQDAAPPRVSIAAAYSEEIVDEAVFIGRGEAIDKVNIVARVSGFLEESLVNDGSPVEQGDLLFRIEDDSYAATLEARKADLARAEANLELAILELDRKQELMSRGSVPVSERDLARANKLVAEAEVRAAKAAIRQAELDLSYTEVSAPFPGRIGSLDISVGDLVGPGTPPLVTLIRESPIYVTFSLDEKQLTDVIEAFGNNSTAVTRGDVGPDVFVELPNGSTLDETGRVVFIDNRIDPTTGAVALRAQFDNDAGLIVDGAFLNVRIQALEPVVKTLVPLAAVQRDQRGDFVLLVNQNQMVEQRYIETGDQVETAIVVTEGLQPGESVIVEGLQRVRPGVPVDPVLTGTADADAAGE